MYFNLFIDLYNSGTLAPQIIVYAVGCDNVSLDTYYLYGANNEVIGAFIPPNDLSTQHYTFTSGFHVDSITGYPVSGTYKISSLRSKTSLNFPFEAEFPTINLSVTHSCITSILKSVDTTDYRYSLNGNLNLPLNTSSSTETIVAPLTTPTPIADNVTIGNLNPTINISSIWSGIYKASIVSVVSWQVPIVTGLVTNYVSVQVQLLGTTYHTVTCLADCICGLKYCIIALMSEWNVNSTNERRREQLRAELDRLNDLMCLYNLAINCGDDVLLASTCSAIKTLILKNNCSCDITDTTTSGVSTQIVPLVPGNSGTTVVRNGIFFGAYPSTTPPDVSVGNNDDIAINNDGTDGSMWQKINSAWSIQGDFMPTPPSAVTAYELLNNDSTEVGTPANTTKTLLNSFIIPTALNSYNDDTFVKISVLVWFESNVNPRSVVIDFLNNSISYPVLQDELDYEITAYNNVKKYEIILNKLSSSAQMVEYEVKGRKGSIEDLYFITHAMDTNNRTMIRVYGQNGVASAGDIYIENLKVEIFKK